jgi:hypothetical protein
MEGAVVSVVQGKPTVPEVAPAVRALYARSGAGCCLHIVLDDGNVEDSSVDFCVRYAQEQGHLACEKLARTLRMMSRTQRLKLGHLPSKRGPTIAIRKAERLVVTGFDRETGIITVSSE